MHLLSGTSATDACARGGLRTSVRHIKCTTEVKLMTTLVYVFCALLTGLAVFQGLLIAGLPLGHFAFGGQNRVLPPRLRLGSAASIVIYAVFATTALVRGNVIDVIPNEGFAFVLMWVIAGYLLLGVVMNLLSRSRAERFTMAPLSLVLGLIAGVIAGG